MIATIGSGRRELHELSVVYEDRLRQSEGERLREHRYWSYQAQEAERVLQEAQASHEAEIRKLEEELQRQRRRADAERHRSETLEDALHRLREDRRRRLAEGESLRDLEASREEIRRLVQGNDQLRQRVGELEVLLQESRRDLHAARGECDRSQLEQRRLQEQLRVCLEKERQRLGRQPATDPHLQGPAATDWSSPSSGTHNGWPVSAGEAAFSAQPTWSPPQDQPRQFLSFDSLDSFGGSPSARSGGGSPKAHVSPGGSSTHHRKSGSPGGSRTGQSGRRHSKERGAMRRSHSPSGHRVSFSTEPEFYPIEVLPDSFH